MHHELSHDSSIHIVNIASLALPCSAWFLSLKARGIPSGPALSVLRGITGEQSWRGTRDYSNALVIQKTPRGQ
ncbi:Proteasome subunit beta type-6 [Fusarium oxysporum f. sp. albedinis]|nr:Proteasome subunit beta type-6 [Fusarium oxysporum f. sp. albedinis]